jgi:hypothetical protein
VAFSAAIPIISLRREISPRPLDAFLTVVLYAAPYLAIALSPIHWERLQIGFGIGYPLSMFITLQLYLRSGSLMPSVPPVPSPPLVVYEIAMFLDVILILVSVVVLIWHRSRLNDLFVLTLSFLGGLGYPLLPFALIALHNPA